MSKCLVVDDGPRRVQFWKSDEFDALCRGLVYDVDRLGDCSAQVVIEPCALIRESMIDVSNRRFAYSSDFKCFGIPFKASFWVAPRARARDTGSSGSRCEGSGKPSRQMRVG